MINQGVTGEIIVIVGASSGLGEVAAKLLSEQGATIALGARWADRILALANEVTSHGGQAIAVATDVTNPEQVKQLVDRAVQPFGWIAVIINYAGVMPHSPLERLKIDEAAPLAVAAPNH